MSDFQAVAEQVRDIAFKTEKRVNDTGKPADAKTIAANLERIGKAEIERSQAQQLVLGKFVSNVGRMIKMGSEIPSNLASAPYVEIMKNVPVRSYIEAVGSFQDTMSDFIYRHVKTELHASDYDNSCKEVLKTCQDNGLYDFVDSIWKLCASASKKQSNGLYHISTAPQGILGANAARLALEMIGFSVTKSSQAVDFKSGIDFRAKHRNSMCEGDDIFLDIKTAGELGEYISVTNFQKTPSQASAIRYVLQNEGIPSTRFNGIKNIDIPHWVVYLPSPFAVTDTYFDSVLGLPSQAGINRLQNALGSFAKSNPDLEYLQKALN